MEVLTAFANYFSQEWAQELAVIVGVGAVFLKLWRDFSDFRYAVTFKRPLERLAHLSEATDQASDLAQALKTLVHLEVFRIAFDVRTSPSKSAALVRIFQTGRFSVGELRVIARFVEPRGDQVAIQIGIGDTVAAWTAGIALCFLTAVFGAALIQLFFDGKAAAVLGSVIVALFWLAAVYLLSADIRNLIIAKRAKTDLAESGLLVE